jgi:type I site-specific restriction endonuclease
LIFISKWWIKGKIIVFISIHFIEKRQENRYKFNNKSILSVILRNEILVSNYQLLSTGISIKRLFNAILASPLKAYTTITQTIGRGLRLHPDKKLFNLYDVIDNFSNRQPSGIFVKQYAERCRNSYNPEEFPIQEVTVQLI